MHFLQDCKGGESESWAVYEYDSVKAFLGINPVGEGHALVISNTPEEALGDGPRHHRQEAQEDCRHCGEASRDVQKTLDVRAVNLLHASGKEAQQKSPTFTYIWCHAILMMD